MVFKPDVHAGVWGNEEAYQFAMRHYTKFLGNHPVWGYKNITKEVRERERERLLFIPPMKCKANGRFQSRSIP